MVDYEELNEIIKQKSATRFANNKDIAFILCFVRNNGNNSTSRTLRKSHFTRKEFFYYSSFNPCKEWQETTF